MTATTQDRIDALAERLEQLQRQAEEHRGNAETIAIDRRELEKEVLADYREGKISEEHVRQLLGNGDGFAELEAAEIEDAERQAYIDKTLDGLQVLASRVLVEKCRDYETAARELARRFEALDDLMTAGGVPSQWQALQSPKR